MGDLPSCFLLHKPLPLGLFLLLYPPTQKCLGSLAQLHVQSSAWTLTLFTAAKYHVAFFEQQTKGRPSQNQSGLDWKGALITIPIITGSYMNV